ncbi:uracil-DNA glycosylase [Aquibacillus rhizosphaerae]|uniref:Uracil-DNA glycosylase n=1 Tax=Aquibacillus rhizosphaerae TaxID=3051431 RepID=A0ABT7L4Y2_9BACI|nr:uracil-DNA glycosylase [Aquibacillus sp. LR5S19]MDL4840916.1 uracil-DNA glycosylase [Aquibacillus sp. LR5S19]
MILPNNIHPSWNSFLTEEIISNVDKIERTISTDYNPTDPQQILRFLSIDLNKVKVIWLGQDVYPAKGVATGRSFEVGGLNKWDQTFRQVSVKNIIRLIHKNFYGISDYDQIKNFNDIKKDIATNHFNILPPNRWFDSLEQQGVLFLNTSFTCQVGKANSHSRIWQEFSKQVLNYISIKRPDIIWFLWGNQAKQNKQHIKQGVFYESRHPMMCSKKYKDDFLKSECFLETWDIIDWLG